MISRVASQLKTELIRCFRALGWRVKFWIQKSLGKKKLGIQRILGGKIESKKFIQEKYWVKKKIGPQNNFGLTKIWIPKHFGSQKMFDPKQFQLSSLSRSSRKRWATGGGWVVSRE